MSIFTLKTKAISLSLLLLGMASAVYAVHTPVVSPKSGSGITAYPELTQIRFFEGVWNCDSTLPAGSMGPDSPAVQFKSKLTLRGDLDGFGYVVSVVQKKSAVEATTEGKSLLAYNPVAKKFEIYSITSNGGSGLLLSDGFVGDVITMAGDIVVYPGMMIGYSEDLAKISDREYHRVAKLDLKDGNGFQVFQTDICRK